MKNHHDASDAQSTSTVLNIGELSDRTGVHIKAIRYYEQTGILPEPARGPNGYRRYTQADVHRVNLLRRLRFLGTALSEARPLLDATVVAPCHVVQTELLHLVEARLAELDREMAELGALRQHVQECQARLATTPVAQEGPFAQEEPFALCFDGSCLACSRLNPTEEQVNRTRQKAQGFYEE